jgi:hypothetical protein
LPGFNYKKQKQPSWQNRFLRGASTTHFEAGGKDSGSGLKATEGEQSGAFAQVAFPPVGIELNAARGIFQRSDKVA